MEFIRDKDGNIIHKFKNMRGIREYVGGRFPPMITKIDISKVGDEEGQLSILFENGNTYQKHWINFYTLVHTIHNWINIQGAPLSINGVDVGRLTRSNEAVLDLIKK